MKMASATRRMSSIVIYKLVDGFLYRVYRPLERKILEHQQAQIILKVMGSSLASSIDYKNLWAFIEAHPILKAVVGSERDLKFHLQRLIQIGVVSEVKIG